MTTAPMHFSGLRIKLTSFEQMDKMTAVDLFGTIGGNLGLFVGVSLTTILELLEFVIIYIRDKRWNLTKDDKRQKMTKDDKRWIVREGKRHGDSRNRVTNHDKDNKRHVGTNDAASSKVRLNVD